MAVNRSADMALARSSHTKFVRTRRLPDGSWNGILCAAAALWHQLEAEMDRALAIVPLTARGFATLAEIAREPPSCQGTLAAHLGLQPSTTSELLKRLERRGLLRRRPKPIVLTDRGAAALAVAERIATRVEDAWAHRFAQAGGSQLGDARLQGLRRWLNESRAALLAAAGDAPTRDVMPARPCRVKRRA